MPVYFTNNMFSIEGDKRINIREVEKSYEYGYVHL